MSLPLSGIKILDASRVLASPFAAYQLSLLGAVVIKVENPLTRGDPSRHGGIGRRDAVNAAMAASFLSLSANKRSITLNLATKKGQEIFRRLAGEADVVVENMRTGTMDKYGLGYADLAKLNPRLVYCSITGYGQTGPKKSHPAYDPVIQAASGMMDITGSPEGAPMKSGAPVIDMSTGLVGAFAIVTALFERAKTGKGQHLDVSMLDVSLMMMGSIATDVLTSAGEPKATGNSYGAFLPVNRLYRTGEGMLWIVASEEHQVQRLLKAIQRTELALDPRFADPADRPANVAALTAELEHTFAQRSADEWELLLNEAGVSAMRVRTVPEALNQPQLRTRDLFHTFDKVSGIGRPVTVPLLAFKMVGRHAEVRTPPPALGQHTDEVLREIGVSDADIASLRSEGIV